MKMCKFMMTLVYTILWIGGIGQVIPGQLRRIEVQNKIVNLTAGFDSVILADRAGFFNEDFKIEGFGFRGSEVYKLRILFRESVDHELSDFRKKRLLRKKRINAVRTINYSAVETLDNDSLSIKSRTGISIKVSDNDEWTLLLLAGQKIVIKQSYAPEIYQQAAPTKERELFMSIVKQVISLTAD